MTGAAIVFKNTNGVTLFENKSGIKGAAIQTSRRQFIETSFGFKGAVFAMEPHGQAIKINRRKSA